MCEKTVKKPFFRTSQQSATAIGCDPEKRPALDSWGRWLEQIAEAARPSNDAKGRDRIPIWPTAPIDLEA